MVINFIDKYMIKTIKTFVEPDNLLYNPLWHILNITFDDMITTKLIHDMIIPCIIFVPIIIRVNK